jgi:hypothetical protein
VSRAGGGAAFMELIALISALAIAGIFVFAHYDRQSRALDHRAMELAEQIAPAVKAWFVENPAAELTSQQLAFLPGVTLNHGFKAEVVRGAGKADNWELRVWHPEGTRMFLVNSQKIREEYL